MAAQHMPMFRRVAWAHLIARRAAPAPVQTAAIRDVPHVGAIAVVRAEQAAVQIVAAAAVIQARLESVGRGADF